MLSAMSDDVALTAARAWLAEDPDPETAGELRALIDRCGAQDAAARLLLDDAFAAPLEFGTAGLRGILGPGPNRMNRVVVRRTTAGLADYLLAQGVDPALGVVIGHDARKNSRVFAEDAARVLAGRGVAVKLAPGPWPTPVTGWLSAGAAAGIMITASHNPPEYNGYKVYWSNGAQIVPPHDTGIAAAIAAIGPLADIAFPELDRARAVGRVVDLDARVLDDYVAAIQALRTTPHPRTELVVAYTPLHGVGAAAVEAGFAAAGTGPLHVVASQREPDPAFPTVAFPNPEEKGAMDAVLALAADVKAELVLANDPDADRLCVAVPDGAGGYRVLTGDQTGALLADYLLETTHDGRRLVATTIVSSQLLSHLAAAYGADYRETLTGFKWIGNAAIEWKTQTGGFFVMGYEEALGYSVGELVRDKDGVSAALLAAELAAWNRARGRTLLDHLDEVYRKVGLFVTEQVSLTRPGADGLASIRASMIHFRANPPQAIGGVPVGEVVDLSLGAGGLPRSDVLVYRLAGGRRVIMRPSGTEPKLKSYYEVRVEVGDGESMAAARQRGLADLAALRDSHQSLLAASSKS
jgi:phosphomannomutase